jgi:hypothetical protein
MTAAIYLPQCFEGNVMRTPWRFVADLVSRKPKPESAAVAQKTIALEYKPVSEEEHPSIEPAAVVRAVEPGPEASLLDQDTGATDVEPAAPVAVDAPVAAVNQEEPAALLTPRQSEETSPAPTLTEVAETPVKRAPARRTKVEPTAKLAVSIIQTEEVGPAIAVGPKSFLDEMADLDTEVGALRRQLAEKLNEQNAQLRKMLARFNAG